MILDWINARLPDRLDWAPGAVARAVAHAGRTVAAWAWCPGGGGEWDLTVAAEPRVRWVTRPVLVNMLGFPFQVLGASRLVTIVAADNAPSLAQVPRLGFVYERTIPAYWPRMRDGIVFGLRPAQCRWLNG